MAAFDPPFLKHMATARNQRGEPMDASSLRSSSETTRAQNDAGPTTFMGAPTPTYAAFSPTPMPGGSANFAAAAKRRSTILVHQKSPLLLATPPQVTRALAYSHPFILVLNRVLGLITWSSGDPWQSFLMLCGFWIVMILGDKIVQWLTPLLLVFCLIAGMWGRRFSPLSSSSWGEPGPGAGGDSGAAAARRAKNLSVNSVPDKKGGAVGGKTGTPNGHVRNASVADGATARHQKTLDEMVEVLKQFSTRCEILLEPLMELTEFLSTQRTPTSATTRPALIALLVRVFWWLPVWLVLASERVGLITTHRVVLVCGTVLLSWHSRPMRVTRTVLWRSVAVRRLVALVTGLPLDIPGVGMSQHPPAGKATATASTANSTAGKAPADGQTTGLRNHLSQESELTKAIRRTHRREKSTGVRFTFVVYENQRRWFGLGWTNKMLPTERDVWTDEHNNPVPSIDQFELPEVEDGGNVRWQWVEGSRWRVEGVPDEIAMPEDGKGDWDYDKPEAIMGWVFYDNMWQNGRRGLDGWNRFTRRRKWYRDAELVEIDHTDVDNNATPNPSTDADASTSSDQANTPRPLHTPTASSSSVPTVGRNTPDPSSSDANTPPTPPNQPNREPDDDPIETDSVFSTSSRSLFPFPSLAFRRRVSGMGPMPAGDTASTSSGSMTGTRPQQIPHRRVFSSSSSVGSISGASARSRRTSSAAAEDDAAILGTRARIAVQEAGEGASASSWGIGDDVRMGLE